MQFKDVSGGKTFFKPAEHQEDVAILIEPTGIQRNVPGNFGPRDQVTADVTYFATKKDVEEGNGDFNEAVSFNQTHLVSGLADIIGEATVVKVGQSKPKPGQKPAWIWDAVDKATMTKIGEYVDKRDAQIAADVEEGPDF